MKKIAFFSGDITGNGGTERVAAVLMNALALKGAYEVSVISLTKGNEIPSFELDTRVQNYALAEKKPRVGPDYLPLIFRLRSYVQKHGIDVLIDIDGVLDVLSLPVRVMTGVRVISWEHFYYYDARGTWYRRPIRRLSVHHADAIVTLTERDRDFYLSRGAAPERVRAIHNPMYEPFGAAAPRELPMGKKVIFSAGALSRIKGFAQVPLIASELKKQFPALDFVWEIAGEGAQRGQIVRLAEQYGVQDEIRLLGQQTAERMRELYAGADLYVMTSEREGMPMVLLEAKQNGLPIVSYDIRTGPSEIISDGTNGCLIPYTGRQQTDTAAMAAAIGGILTDAARYRSFAAHTADDRADFELEHIVMQWEELLKQVLGE